MAENSGFFADVNGDREYTTSFLADWVASFIGNGVYDGELGVTANDDMTVTIPAGRAWINGYFYHNDSDLTLNISNADGVLDRKDIIVLRWDVNERSITAQVIDGEFSSEATAPDITRTDEQYDLKLAEISIPAGTTKITQSMITDTRLDTDVCGIVTSIIDQVDTSTFYDQIQSDLAEFKSQNEADFTAWVDGLKEVLDESTAGNLLNLINEHKADTIAHMTQTQKDQLAAAVPNSRKINGHALTEDVNLTAEDTGAARVSSITNTTIPASGWVGSAAPYSQTIEISGVTATSANEILPGASITADQLTALQAANIQDGGQAVGSITLKAWGDKPTIDLPVRIIVRGDL